MSDPEFEITPVYRSAVNAVTKPTSLASISRYVVEKWLPELGGDGLAILAFLRKKCFYNRETGERRETVRCKLSDIAAGCGTSPSTVRRQLQRNTALRQFIGIHEEFELDPKRGGLYRVENSYTVTMDDPVHPSDMAQLQDEIRRIQLASEKGAEDPKERARRRAAERADATPYQNDRALESRELQRPTKLEGGPVNLTGGPTKLEGGACQNGRANIDGSLSSSIPIITSYPAALPGDSLALFSEKAEEESQAGKDAFPEDQRALWEEKARTLFVINGVPAPRRQAISRQAEALWRIEKDRRGHVE